MGSVRQTTITAYSPPIVERYEPIQVGELTYIRLLLRVGIKVVDEWQKCLGYVRGSNIYVRGYLD